MRRIALATATLLAFAGTSYAAGTSCKVSMSDYNLIKAGMTLSAAEALVGCKGEEMSQSEMYGMKFATVTWDGRGGPASLMMLSLTNGKVQTKAQVGLK
jgi:hypothetical protein